MSGSNLNGNAATCQLTVGGTTASGTGVVESATSIVCTFAANTITGTGQATIKVSPDAGKRWTNNVAVDKEVIADCTPPPTLSGATGCVDPFSGGSLAVTGSTFAAVGGSAVQCRVNDGPAFSPSAGGTDSQVTCPIPAGLQPPSATIAISRENGRWSAPLQFQVSADCDPPVATSAAVSGGCIDVEHGLESLETSEEFGASEYGRAKYFMKRARRIA